MDAADPHFLESRLRFDLDFSICGQGLVVLRDLVALRQVRIKIIFAGENAFGVNLTSKREPNADRQLDSLFVQDWQGARLTRTNGTNIVVWFGGNRIDHFASAKHLGVGE